MGDSGGRGAASTGTRTRSPQDPLWRIREEVEPRPQVQEPGLLRAHRGREEQVRRKRGWGRRSFAAGVRRGAVFRGRSGEGPGMASCAVTLCPPRGCERSRRVFRLRALGPRSCACVFPLCADSVPAASSRAVRGPGAGARAAACVCGGGGGGVVGSSVRWRRVCRSLRAGRTCLWSQCRSSESRSFTCLLRFPTPQPPPPAGTTFPVIRL